MSEDESPVDFFISYTGADAAWAKWIDWQLRDAGYSTLVMVYDFPAGANFPLEMQRAQERAGRMVAIWSTAYFRSTYCASEMAVAFALDPDGKRRRLLPVLVEAMSPPNQWRPVVQGFGGCRQNSARAPRLSNTRRS